MGSPHDSLSYIRHPITGATTPLASHVLQMSVRLNALAVDTRTCVPFRLYFGSVIYTTYLAGLQSKIVDVATS